jgi:DNA-binding XRE family transcriptional regulator
MERAAPTSGPQGPRIALKAARTSAGLAHAELAFRVGLSKSALAGIENGHHAPGLDVASKIADTLGVDVADLFHFHPCECGCGELTAKRFISGHNAGRPEHRAGLRRAHRERRAQLGIPEEKRCERCGRWYSRSEVPNQSLAHWLARRSCSGDCRWPSRVEERFCAYWKCWKLFTSDDNSPTRLFHGRECAQRNRWDELIRDGKPLVSPKAISALPTKAAKRQHGRLSIRKRERTRRSYTDEQVAEVKRLEKRGYGHDTIASITGLSRPSSAIVTRTGCGASSSRTGESSFPPAAGTTCSGRSGRRSHGPSSVTLRHGTRRTGSATQNESATSAAKFCRSRRGPRSKPSPTNSTSVTGRSPSSPSAAACDRRNCSHSNAATSTGRTLSCTSGDASPGVS